MANAFSTDQPPSTPIGDPGPITEWVQRFDDESINELMRHYRPLLRTIVARNWNHHFQQRLDPSDAVQLTWTSIASKASKNNFKDRKHFGAYLIRTLRSQLVDIRRMLFAEKRRVTNEVTFSNAGVADDFNGVTEDLAALDHLIHQELVHDVLQAILRMPRELQRLLRWKFRKGMTYEQIAEKIGSTERKVRTLVQKCVREITYEVRRKHPISL